jgi:hypothetical protein
MEEVMTTSKKTAKGAKKSAKTQSKKSVSRKVGAASQDLSGYCQLNFMKE